MFTGIVEEVGRVVALEPPRLTIGARQLLEDLRVGSSIAVNGACLTVTDLDADSFTVELTPETLRRTNLGLLKPAGGVNLERPLPVNGRLGGHIVQGHVDATGSVLSVTPEGNSLLLRCAVPPNLLPQIVEKGFIAVDGVSLTVVERDASSFVVSVIPYTREQTVLGTRRPGDKVNLEVDILAKYIQSLLQTERPS
ncbi:MAG: riboflavin synthase [Dehalococcoidia bacterium]